MILHNIYSCASNKLDYISDIKILNKKYYIIASNYIHLISSDDFKCVKCIERFCARKNAVILSARGGGL